MHLRLSIGLLLVLAFYWVQFRMPPVRFSFYCVKECYCGFGSRRGLSLHQGACKLYKEDQRRQFRELALAAEAEEVYVRQEQSTVLTITPSVSVSLLSRPNTLLTVK